MPKSRKYIYISVIVTATVFVLYFIYEFFISGRSFFGQVSKEVTSKPAARAIIDGQIFSTGPLGNPNEVPCASRSEEALNLMTSELEKEYESESYFESEIKPLLQTIKVEKGEYFYKVRRPIEIQSSRYSINENVFNCEFFEPSFTEETDVSDETQYELLGYLTAEPTENNFNKLVQLLYNAQIVDLDLLGKKIEIDNTNTVISEDDIVRIDSGIYSPSAGLFANNTQKQTVTVEFRLVKSTKEVFLTKTIE
jgi:hypothetical protein